MELKKSVNLFIRNFLKIIIGTFCMAFAVNFIYEPAGMVTGGVSGLAIVIKKMSGLLFSYEVPVWISNLLLNFPIFLWGLKVKGKKFLGYTFLANLCFTLFLALLPIITFPEQDFFLFAAAGGALNGIGLGIVFAGGFSTGGTDLLGTILHQYKKDVPIAVFLFCIDAGIVLAGMFVFGIYIEIYAILAILISSKVMDMFLSGIKFGKQIWIISEKYREISDHVLKELRRGVTCIEAEGMYKNTERKVLLCAVGRREVVKVTEIVKRLDPYAFMIIQDAKEVLGEGFGRFE